MNTSTTQQLNLNGKQHNKNKHETNMKTQKQQHLKHTGKNITSKATMKTNNETRNQKATTITTEWEQGNTTNTCGTNDDTGKNTQQQINRMGNNITNAKLKQTMTRGNSNN